MKNKYILKITISAILVAMSVILGLFTISIPPGLAFGVSEFPIIFAGLLLGPIYGSLVGFVRDVFTMLQTGYPPSLFTIGKILLGLIPGLFLVILGRNRIYGNYLVTMVIVFITLMSRTAVNTAALHYVQGMTWDAAFATLPFKIGSIVIETFVYGYLLTVLLPIAQRKFIDKLE